MAKWIVAFNPLCVGVNATREWVKVLHHDHLDTSLLIYAAAQMHPAYVTRYLKEYMGWLKLVEVPMFSPTELNRLNVDHRILDDEKEFLWRVLDAQAVFLLSPQFTSWPVPEDFRLSTWIAQTAVGTAGAVLWNSERLGLKRLDRKGILQGREETLRRQVDDYFDTSQGGRK